MNNQRQRILAIDPGREKCGVAVYDREQGVMRQAIVAVDKLMEVVEKWSRDYSCPTIVVGNKTAGRQITDKLAPLVSAQTSSSIVMVDEHKSTEEARLRYWQANPPRGWRKLLPIGLLPPPCAIDDFAAIILAERYFDQNAKNL